MPARRTSLEVIAPSVEEAVARGAAELGLSPDDFEVEVLDEGGKGFLGLSARQARVRLTVRSMPSELGEQGEEEEALEQAPGDGEEDEAVRTSREIVQELIQHMGVRARITARWGIADPDSEIQPLLVDLQGDDLGLLIGRRGETLAALQYLTRLIVSKELDRQVAVVIDVEGYRARRERQLRRLAQRMAEQAMELGRTMVLEPMPASERRIIHLELRDHPRVSTESTGEGAQRKVTIIPRP
jgi:spoIIIJ-associated protein